MLKLTMTCGPYDRAQALIDKSVRPEGIDLEITVNRRNPGASTRGPDGPFDIAEFYTGQYMYDVAAAENDYTAVPIFVKRMFRHSYIYINNKCGVRAPRDLNGKRIGLQNWFTSAGLWARGMLEDDWGLDPRSVTWVVEHGKRGVEGWIAPSWLKLETAPAGRRHEDLLAAGELQGLLSTAICAPDEHPNIDFLFPDYGQVERDYFRRTGFFPIMHTLLIRTELLEKEPWVAMSMFNAWMASKQACYDKLAFERIHKTDLWYRALWEEQVARAGKDFYKWGFGECRAEVDKMLEYVFRYGMTKRKVAPEELFHPSTLLT
jgi:4,5-dihydroxyphthalate decarboxylase